MQFTATVVTVTAFDKLNEQDARVKYKDVLILMPDPPNSGVIEIHVPSDAAAQEIGLVAGQKVSVTLEWPVVEAAPATAAPGPQEAASASEPAAPVSPGGSEAAVADPVVPTEAVTPSAGEPEPEPEEVA